MVKKSKKEKFVYTGDTEMDLPKVLVIEPKAKNIVDAIKKAYKKERGYKAIEGNPHDVADELEEYFGGYVDIWRGIYKSKSGKAYLVEGCFDESRTPIILWFRVKRITKTK